MFQRARSLKGKIWIAILLAACLSQATQGGRTGGSKIQSRTEFYAPNLPGEVVFPLMRSYLVKSFSSRAELLAWWKREDIPATVITAEDWIVFLLVGHSGRRAFTILAYREKARRFEALYYCQAFDVLSLETRGIAAKAGKGKVTLRFAKGESLAISPKKP